METGIVIVEGNKQFNIGDIVEIINDEYNPGYMGIQFRINNIYQDREKVSYFTEVQNSDKKVIGVFDNEDFKLVSSE